VRRWDLVRRSMGWYGRSRRWMLIPVPVLVKFMRSFV